MKEPPDPDITSNYRTVKVPLKKVLKHYDLIQPRLENAVLVVNEFASIGYEFLKLYLISKFENEEKLPKITKALITSIFSCIGQKKNNQGRKPSVGKGDDVKKFYDNTFSKIYTEKPCSTNLTYVLPLLAEEMVRCFETNIKTHFIAYLSKYINITHRNPQKDTIKKSTMTKEEKHAALKTLYADIKGIKNDMIIGKVDKSAPQYHQWIKDNIKSLLPSKIEKNVAYDVKVSPNKYLYASFVINKAIEDLGRRTYQIIPQRTNLVPKNITLNTSGIVEVINDKKTEIYGTGYSKMSNNTKRYQKHAWREILKLENDGVFKHKGYVFYNQIQTDGISASLLFIREDFYDKTYGQRMPSDDVDFIIRQINRFNKTDCDNYKDRTLIGTDPGKKSIITMTDGAGKFYSYSNARRRFESYGKRSTQIILVEKKEQGITEMETVLSKSSGRSYVSGKYEEYLSVKAGMTGALNEFYQRSLFRKLALRRYCKTLTAESRMLDEIEKSFGAPETVLIGLGNWSNNTTKQMKGCMPSPNKGIFKLLTKRFDVVEVDEFRTSKIYHDDLTTELVNVRVKRKPIHELLTLTGKPMSVILNRDKNAARNIQLILETHINQQIRPEAFCRK